jgi:hypothetical protein
MTQEEAVEFDRFKTARDSLLLTVANLRGQLETIKEALAQPEQKCPNLKNCNGACFQCEYFNIETGEMEYPVAQLQRTWVGLTDVEIMQIWGGIIKYETSEVRIKYFARAIESKMKEINT